MYIFAVIVLFVFWGFVSVVCMMENLRIVLDNLLKVFLISFPPKKNLKDPTNTTVFRQAPSTLTANTVNNNCDMAPDEV